MPRSGLASSPEHGCDGAAAKTTESQQLSGYEAFFARFNLPVSDLMRMHESLRSYDSPTRNAAKTIVEGVIRVEMLSRRSRLIPPHLVVLAVECASLALPDPMDTDDYASTAKMARLLISHSRELGGGLSVNHGCGFLMEKFWTDTSSLPEDEVKWIGAHRRIIFPFAAVFTERRSLSKELCRELIRTGSHPVASGIL